MSGSPGTIVSIEAHLHTGGTVVGAAQADITFDSINTPFALLSGGAPDCTRNPELNKQFIVVFRPIGCIGTACTMLRTFIFAETFPIAPIAEGTLLYTCRIAIQPSAPRGSYPLSLSAVALSDVGGNVVPGAVGLNGAINVVDAVPPTNTATPSATFTSTPTSTLTPTATVKPVCAGDCNGDGEVTIDELLTMVNISLETQAVGTCTAGDSNHDGAITIEEIIAAVNNAANGCL